METGGWGLKGSVINGVEINRKEGECKGLKCSRNKIGDHAR
jgi:hypothetical protein